MILCVKYNSVYYSSSLPRVIFSSILYYIWGPMKSYILVLALLAAQTSNADDFKLLDVSELSVTYKNFLDGGRDPLITSNGLSGKEPGLGLELRFTVDVLKYLYVANQVHSMTDSGLDGTGGQFRTVGWEYECGLRVAPFLNVFFYHHSQHLLDTTYQHDAYPVQDAFGFRLNLISKDKKESLL